jgi:hypothetical protein
MLSARLRWWLTAGLLVACEASPASRGPSAEPEPEDHGPVIEGDAAAHDAGNRDRDAAGEEMTSDATTDGAADDNQRDAAADADTALDDAGARPDATEGESGETLFVSVGGADNTPWLYTSCDGRAWTRRLLSLPAGHPSTGEGSGLRGVAYGAGKFVITGGGTGNGNNVRLLASSVDGLNWQWEERAGPCNDCQWMGGAAFLDDGKDGLWIAGGGTGTRLYSRDGGRSWQESSTTGIAPYRRFRSQGARAVGAGQGVLSVIELAPAGAVDPVVWRDSAQPIAHETAYIAAGNDTFVVVWYNDGCRFLREGTWRSCDLPDGHDPVLTSVVFGDGKFSIIGRGAPLESSDGEHWTLVEDGTGTDFRDVTYAADSYVTPTLYSSDARTWQVASPGAEHGSAIASGRLGPGQRCPR